MAGGKSHSCFAEFVLVSQSWSAVSDEQCAAKCARRVRCQGVGGENPNNIGPTGELKKKIILKPKSAGNQRARSQPDELQLNISVTFVSFCLCVKYVIFSFLYLDFIIAFYMIALAG